jgi:hypothetical protein
LNVARARLASLAGVSLIKRRMEAAEERGWRSGGDKHVCAEHVEDDALARLITEGASTMSCSYLTTGRSGRSTTTWVAPATRHRPRVTMMPGLAISSAVVGV